MHYYGWFINHSRYFDMYNKYMSFWKVEFIFEQSEEWKETFAQLVFLSELTQ